MARRMKQTFGDRSSLDRRGFLKAATLAGTGAVSQAAISADALAATTQSDPTASAPERHTMQIVSREGEQGAPHHDGTTQTSCGSDFMVDVMRGLGIEYVATKPNNTFIGLHESVINYGMTTPVPLELISCMHEEISVAVSHGYAKIAGKPMACMMHSTVGLQHGAMASYNAWADRVPVFAIVGAQLDASKRGGYVDLAHSVFDSPALVRDFTKWDDTPLSLRHFAESATRAHKFSMTPPYGPAVLAVDQELQEDAIKGNEAPVIPRMPEVAPPRGDDGAVNETARLLAAAENPLIVADRAARTPAGLRLLIEMAEELQAPVVDIYGRMNFPWRHPLNQTRRQALLVTNADVILGLELTDFWGVTRMAHGAKRISITAGDLYMKSNYQDFDRFTPVDIALAADAEATLPALIEAVRKLITPKRRASL